MSKGQPEESSYEGVTKPLSTASTKIIDGASLSAVSSIIPAIASTACCWGPAVLSMFGGAAIVAGSSSTNSVSHRLLRNISRYRPYLLGMSTTMICYSFYQVYGPPSSSQQQQQQQQQQTTANACCHTAEKTQKNSEAHAQKLAINRGVVWASLAVAVAGATYGYVSVIPPTVIGAVGATTSFGGGKRAATQIGAALASSSSSTSPTSNVVRLKVDGMVCGACASKVQRSIEQAGIDGVENVAVYHKTGEAVINGSVDMKHDLVKKTITQAGYNVVSR